MRYFLDTQMSPPDCQLYVDGALITLQENKLQLRLFDSFKVPYFTDKVPSNLCVRLFFNMWAKTLEKGVDLVEWKACKNGQKVGKDENRNLVAFTFCGVNLDTDDNSVVEIGIIPEVAGQFLLHLVLNDTILDPIEVEIIKSDEHLKRDQLKQEQLLKK